MNKNTLSIKAWIGILALVLFFCFRVDTQAYSKVKLSVLHVDEMKGSLESDNDGAKGKVVVTITDDNDQPVADVQVMGKWGGLFKGMSYGITGDDGTVCFVSESTIESGIITFQIKNVGVYGYQYDQSQNKEDQLRISTEVDSNLAPVAVMTPNSISGSAPLNITLCGSMSYDQDGSIVGYKWDLGDGTQADLCTINHCFNVPGNYNAKLTVIDDQGNEASVETIIYVIDPSVPM